MSRRGWASVALVASIAGSCATLALHSPARADAPLVRAIVGGEASPQEDAVVALLTAQRKLGCTGTLIRPHVILTAAHCIDAAANEPATLFVGADLGKPGQSFQIIARLIHPEFDPASLSADVGLLGVDGELDIDPVEIARSKRVGVTDVRAVGFGCTDLADDSAGVGLRRSRDDTITEVTVDHKLRHGDATCRGDSGGPLFMDEGGVERVLGVHSSGGSKGGKPFSYATSLPNFADWVAANADQLELKLTPPDPNEPSSCTVGQGSHPAAIWPVPWLGLLAVCAVRARLCRRRNA